MADEPLHTATYMLTGADALAYEQATARYGAPAVAGLVLWLGLWAAAAWLLPSDWSGIAFGWGFSILVSILIAIGFVLALIGESIVQWLRARARIGAPVEVTLGEWPDRLELSVGNAPRTLLFADIREAVLTGAYLFVVSDGDVLIVPRRALPEEGALDALARRIAGMDKPPVVDPAPANA